MTKILEKVFSVKNDCRGTHKIVNIAGVKVKVRKGGVKNFKENLTYFIDKNNPLYKAQIKDGYLRLLLTHRCNAKCDFCPHWKWSEDKLKQELSHEFIFDQCKPLYSKIKMLSLCGGEVTIYKHGIEFGEFINKNYPHITVVTESNGINWNEKWQKNAREGLWSVNFSVNGSNEEVYHKSCWREEDYHVPYQKTQENILNYIKSLKECGHGVFAPGVSMVVNKDSADDIYAFAKYALTIGARRITYYFDNQESDLSSCRTTKNFKYPEKSLPALRTMMEIERVLAKKICVYFRLWLPEEGITEMQNEVDSIPIQQLREKYAELLELAKDRDMLKEHNERNRIRRKQGKKELTFDEDFNATLRLTQIGDKKVCFAPWRLIDIMANGKLSFCSWARGTTGLKYVYDKNGNIDWVSTLNTKPYIQYRKKHFNNDFSGCQAICPMNSAVRPITPVHKYGFDREVE
ncbi:MAG: radical SAM protein [Candidatus Gastranaerophilales bacterium]|nr:radical SAM protein [Candidatus Gastranaerophilales bacterium]